MSIISDLFLSRHPAIASPFTASIRSFVFSDTLSPQSDKNWINKLISGRQQSLPASGKFGCVAQNGAFLYNSTAVRSLSSRDRSSFPFRIIEAELYRQFPLLVAFSTVILQLQDCLASLLVAGFFQGCRLINIFI